MGFTDANDMIDVAHRIKGDAIIVLFYNRTTRDSVYYSRTKLKGKTTKDLVLTDHGMEQPSKGELIFINKSLSFERRKLMMQVKHRMKEINVYREKDTKYHVGSIGGKVAVMDSDRKLQVIWSLNDLYKLHPTASLYDY